MSTVVSDLKVGKVFKDEFGSKRKILELSDFKVKFIVTDVGSKPPVNFKLMQEYELDICQFILWSKEETEQ